MYEELSWIRIDVVLVQELVGIFSRDPGFRANGAAKDSCAEEFISEFDERFAKCVEVHV